MATSFYTKSGGGRYCLTLETDRLEHYKFVQEAARICVDGKNASFEPVANGQWETDAVTNDEFPMFHHFHNDPKCKYSYSDYDCAGTPYCPICGAKMNVKDATEITSN